MHLGMSYNFTCDIVLLEISTWDPNKSNLDIIQLSISGVLFAQKM